MAKGDFKKNIEGAKETMDELLFATRDFTDEVKKSAKEVFGIGTSANQATKAFRDIGTSIQNMSANMDDIVKGNVTVKDLAKEQNKLSKSQAKFQVEYRQALGKTKLTQTQIKDILSGQLDYEDAILNDLDDMDSSLSGLLDKYHQQAKINKENEEIMADMAKRTKNIQKGVGLAGAAFSGLGGILKKAGLGDIGDKMGLDKAVSEGKKLSATLTNGGVDAVGLGGKLRIAGKMAATIGESLMASFGPIALIGMALGKLVTAIKQVDKEAGELAKNTGISYNNALKLNAEYREMAQSSGDLRVHQKDIAKTQAALNSKFGTSAKFTGKLATDMASIQKRTQLSDKAMTFYAKNVMKTGKPLKEQLKNVTKTVFEQNKQRKLVMGVKQVQEAIAKTSNTVRLHAKDNVEHLTKSVMAAKELGASMETIEGIGASLLDFESSIAAELEAELLLGQDINLEKARAYALEGNTLGLTEEIMSNKAIMNAFDTKNVIAQEAAAKALGLSRSQLADMVMEQSNLKALQSAGLGEITSMNEAQVEYNRLSAEGLLTEEMKDKLAEEGLLKQLESTSQAEKMEDQQNKVNELFIQLAEKIMPKIEKFMNFMSSALGGIFKVVKFVYKGFQTLGGFIAKLIAPLGVVGDILVGIGYAAVAAAAYTAFKAAAVIPVVGPALGAAAAALVTTAGFGLLSGISSKMSDGVIGPGGETIVSGPKGTIQLDKQDSMIVGTNLGGKGGDSGGNKQDNSEMLGLLKQIANKNTVIEMGGNEVGQGINTAEREIQ